MSIIQTFIGEIQNTNGALPVGCYEHQRQGDGVTFKSYTNIERHSFSSGFVGNYVSDIGKILKFEKILTSVGASGLFHRYEIEYLNKNGVGGGGPNGGIVSTYDVSILVEEAKLVTKYQVGFSSANASCVITGIGSTSYLSS